MYLFIRLFFSLGPHLHTEFHLRTFWSESRRNKWSVIPFSGTFLSCILSRQENGSIFIISYFPSDDCLLSLEGPGTFRGKRSVKFCGFWVHLNILDVFLLKSLDYDYCYWVPGETLIKLMFPSRNEKVTKTTWITRAMKPQTKHQKLAWARNGFPLPNFCLTDPFIQVKQNNQIMVNLLPERQQ